MLVGDSGQGDVALGLEAREHLGPSFRGVFIHDVVETPDAERERLCDSGVHLFDTYVGAARQALGLGLLSGEAAARIAAAALAEIEALRFESRRAAERARSVLRRDVESLEAAAASCQPG